MTMRAEGIRTEKKYELHDRVNGLADGRLCVFLEVHKPSRSPSMLGGIVSSFMYSYDTTRIAGNGLYKRDDEPLTINTYALSI